MEEGSHIALMMASGRYADLYSTDFRHQSPDYRPGEGFVAVSVNGDAAAGVRRIPLPDQPH